ncbi:MAG: hypothetical protein ACI90V_003231, partial [Bacillariaceae sp.]
GGLGGLPPTKKNQTRKFRPAYKVASLLHTLLQ